MKITELPARTCNVLAVTDPEYLEQLPAVLSVIERESFLGAVVVAYPDFVRTALEYLSGYNKHGGVSVQQQLYRIAAGYLTGKI